jgi:hypothetical protein
MKKLKFSLLFALLVAFLAACGSDDDGGATLGSLLVTVNGPESATVSVTGPSASSQTVAGSTTFADLTPGSYTVSGSADGFETTNETVVVVAGEQAAVGLSLPKIAQPAVNSVTLSPPSLELEVGEVGSLQATVSGNEDLSRDDMGVTYTSSNTDVATVSREGVVTAFAAGTAIITATSDFDPSYFDNTRVTASLGSSNQNQTDGILGIRVEGNEGRAFDFTVTGPGGFSQTVSTSGRTTLTVPAGSYTVAAQEEVSVDASLSYVATSSQQTVTVSAGQLEEVTFAYQRVNPDAETNIATFNFVSAVDAQGEEYATRLERNVSKDVTLSASQTEEVFCVTFEALDAEGNPVTNASVGIDITGAFVGANQNVTFDWDDVITVVPIPSGDCANLSLNTSRSIDTQQVAVDSTLSTDDEGRVTFGLFATDGIRPNPFIANGFGGFEDEPAKVVLTASNADTTLVDELKVWFINITHLTYYDIEPRLGVERTIDNPFRVIDSEGNFARNHMSTEALAGAAQLGTITLDDGTEVGAFVNAFDTENPENNVHSFDTYFYQKQPEVPNRILGEQGFDPEQRLGYMRYEIITGQDDYSLDCGPDANPVSDDLCFDTDGAADLVLRANATAEEFPLDACVRATYVARASFRDDDVFYDFDLKSYTFCKTFRREFLSVVKFADNHVLSWAGPTKNANTGRLINTPLRQVGPIQEGFVDTLRAYNHLPSIEDPFTSTYRIFITNPSSGPIRNLVISDDLPAELGVVLQAIQPSGDFPTYDPDNHTLTWDFRDPALAPLLDELAPGEYLEFSYEVYARQKPGVQWTAPVRDLNVATPTGSFNTPGYDQGWIDYVRAPMYPNYQVNRTGVNNSVVIGNPIAPDPTNAYPDPYCITNGDDFANVDNRNGNNNDVTVEFDFSLPGAPRQVIDYDPIADESDICVVRPLFNITKRRVTDPEINRGETVIYELIARQVDRVADPALPADSAADEREYAWLAELYPWEFGIDQDGRGHRADADWYQTVLPARLGVDPNDADAVPLLPDELLDAAGNRIPLTADVVAPNEVPVEASRLQAPRRSNDTSKLRDNPIGSNVVVFDIFDVGLDYVSDNDLMIINTSPNNSMRFHTQLDPAYASAINSAAQLQATIDGVKSGGSGVRAVSGINPDGLNNPGFAQKRFQFESIDHFLPDDVAVSTITLRANLGSADSTPARTPINGSIGISSEPGNPTVANRISVYLDDWDSDPTTGTTIADVADPNNPGAFADINVDGVWYNCAYLDANNMNQPTPIQQPAFGGAATFAPGSYGASWYNGQRGPNSPEVAYLDGGFFFGRPFDLRPNEDPYPFLDAYGETAGINDYPWDRNDTSNAIGEFLSQAEIDELRAKNNPLSYAPPYNPANLPVSYDPADNIGIGEWSTADFLVGSVNGALAITRPINGTGVDNLNIFAPHANNNLPLPGRNKDEVTAPGGPNPYLQIIDSVTGAIRGTGNLQRGIEGCAAVRAIQDVPPPPVGSIEFTPRGETFEGGLSGANLVAVQALVPVGSEYYYQIDFLNAGDTTIEDIVFTAQFEIPGVVGPAAFFGRQNARYVANGVGDNPDSQIFEGRISPQFPLDVPSVRPFRLLGSADVVDQFGTSGVAGADETNVALVPAGDPNVSPTLNRVVFNNGGEGYDLRTGRVLRLMIKAEGIDLGSEQALFTAYFDDVDGTDADNNGFVDREFREIRDETDIGNNPNN